MASIRDWFARNFTTRTGLTNLVKETALWANPVVGATYTGLNIATGADPIENTYNPTKGRNSDVPLGTYDSKASADAYSPYFGQTPGPWKSGYVPYNPRELNYALSTPEQKQEIIDAYRSVTSNPAVEDFFDTLGDIPMVGQVTDKIQDMFTTILDDEQTRIDVANGTDGGGGDGGGGGSGDGSGEPDVTNLNSEASILGFLQDLLSQGNPNSVGDMPMESDIGMEAELNPIQMLAMKVKTLNPMAGQELWNMANLPLKQIIELYSFRYDICLASNNRERRPNYGIRLQRPKAFRKGRKRIQKRYA